MYVDLENDSELLEIWLDSIHFQECRLVELYYIFISTESTSHSRFCAGHPDVIL